MLLVQSSCASYGHLSHNNMDGDAGQKSSESQQDDKLMEKLYEAIRIRDVRNVGAILDEHPHLVHKKYPTKFGWGISTPLLEACYAGGLYNHQIIIINDYVTRFSFYKHTSSYM